MTSIPFILADAASDKTANAALWIAIGGFMITLAAQITNWIMLKAPQKREVSFTGTPVDKSDFEKAAQANEEVHKQLFAKIGGAERGVEARLGAKIDAHSHDSDESRRLMHQEIKIISNDVAALKKEAELANQRTTLMDGKIDRLIERNSS